MPGKFAYFWTKFIITYMQTQLAEKIWNTSDQHRKKERNSITTIIIEKIYSNRTLSYLYISPTIIFSKRGFFNFFFLNIFIFIICWLENFTWVKILISKMKPKRLHFLCFCPLSELIVNSENIPKKICNRKKLALDAYSCSYNKMGT